MRSDLPCDTESMVVVERGGGGEVFSPLGASPVRAPPRTPRCTCQGKLAYMSLMAPSYFSTLQVGG